MTATSGFGTRFRELREEHEYDIETIAWMTGYTEETIQRLEEGKVSPPNGAELISFLQQLGSLFGRAELNS